MVRHETQKGKIKIKRGCGIFTFVLKAFGEPLTKFFWGI